MQGAAAGTKAPVPHGVQSKEGSPLWVPSWSPYSVNLKKDVRLESCELSFTWDKMRIAAPEAASQVALRDSFTAAVRESQCIRFWLRGSSIPRSTYFAKGFLLVMRV